MLPAHEVHGDAEGTPLVFIHGFPFSRAQWEPQIARFANSHRVVAYDLRGQGASPPGDEPLMIEFLVDDLVELLDHLEIERATLCGLSMGGYVALRAVDRHPERVHGLVLADTRAEADDNAGRVKRAEAIRKIRKDGMEAFAETLLPALFGGKVVDAEGPGVAPIRRMIELTDPVGACQALGAMACRLDLTGRLGEIDTPTLVVVGAQDQITPLAAARTLQAGIPESELVVIPDAGHVSNLSNPEAVDEALSTFLSTRL